MSNEFKSMHVDRIPSSVPYVVERKTGIVHPNTPYFSMRPDLVAPCYDLNGSTDPADADPDYVPVRSIVPNKRRLPTRDSAPQDMASALAELAAERKSRTDTARELEELRQLVAEMRDGKKGKKRANVPDDVTDADGASE